ncbi:hypothetical protein ABBQ38_002150 [Trebouxia sp. C0009 RCD-2024]
MTPSASKQPQAHQQQQQPSSNFAVQPVWEDDVAYLAPALAFNLKLQHELWPLTPQIPTPSSTDRQSLTGDVQSTSNHRLEGQTGLPPRSTSAQLLIRPLRELAIRRAVEVPQSGCRAARVPIATKMVIVRIGVPQIALLTVPASAKGKDEEQPLLPAQPGGNPEPAGQDRMDRTAEAESSGSELDTTQDEEQLITQLQAYFQESIRLLAMGDVFAVPSASTGDMDGVLRSLYSLPTSPQATDDLMHFKVSCLEPACGTSCAIGFNQTNLMLEGMCASPLPVGIAGYMASALPHQACSSQSSQHHAHSDTPDPEPLGSQASPPGTLAAARAAQDSPVAAASKRKQQEEEPFTLLGFLVQDSAALALQVSVLLLGPRGSGRATAVRAATAALGIHLVPFSCHDLKGQSDSQTATALKASLEAAQGFAPVVLLLRHFEVLAESPQGASQAERTATSSRLASTLLDCMTQGSSNTGSQQQPSTSSQRPAAETALSCNGGAGPVIIIACVESADDVPASFRRCFTHEIQLEAPDAAARRRLLQGLLGPVICQQLGPEALESAVTQTAGLLPRDLQALAADAAAAAAARGLDTLRMLPQLPTPSLQLPKSQKLLQHSFETDPKPVGLVGWASDGQKGQLEGQLGASEGQKEQLEGQLVACDGQQQQLVGPVQVCEADVQTSLDRVRQRTATIIGAPKVPDVRWDDVGGLENVKRAILDTVELPLKHPSLFAAGLRQRSGVLLYGPPGTGKTLVAKAVATECSINFLSVKGPELINMYIGESERQVREIFARARRAKPCVLFFDELDSLAPARGAGADSGGVMDRVVSQLLAEVDGVQAGASGGDLFVIGATNRSAHLLSDVDEPFVSTISTYRSASHCYVPTRRVLTQF